MIRKLIKMARMSALSREEKYLASSCDLVELERRQRLIQTGQAPWQPVTNKNLRGWVK